MGKYTTATDVIEVMKAARQGKKVDTFHGDDGCYRAVGTGLQGQVYWKYSGVAVPTVAGRVFRVQVAAPSGSVVGSEHRLLAPDVMLLTGDEYYDRVLLRWEKVDSIGRSSPQVNHIWYRRIRSVRDKDSPETIKLRKELQEAEDKVEGLNNLLRMSVDSNQPSRGMAGAKRKAIKEAYAGIGVGIPATALGRRHDLPPQKGE